MDDNRPDDAPRRRRLSGTTLAAIITGAGAAVSAALLAWWYTASAPDSAPRQPDTPPTRAEDEASPPPANEAAPEDGDGADCDDGCLDRAVDQGASSLCGSCEDDWSSCASAPSSSLLTAGVSSMVILPLSLSGALPSSRSHGRGLAARGALWAIEVYQRRLAPRTRIRCRYTPSCSRYGHAAIARHGLRGGARIALERVRRCNSRVPMGTVDPPDLS